MPWETTKYLWNHLDLSKLSEVDPRLASGEWDINGLMSLTLCGGNTLRQHQVRKNWHPDNIESIALFLARYGLDDLREKLVRLAVTAANKRAGKPHSLREVVEWMAACGSDDLKHRILRAAMSGGGSSRITEKPGKTARPKRKTAKR